MFTLRYMVPSLGLVFAAFSTSPSYQLNSYSVGSGGTNNSSSTTYTAQGQAGEISGGPSSGITYTTNSGSVQTEQANVPTAPTLSNGSGTYFNKLNFIINTAGNPTDAKYSVAVSTSNTFTVTNYVQADGTLGASPVYQTYTQWGGASGTLAIGLTSNTAYWFKMNAGQGKFTYSAYGPSATISTIGGPTVDFSVSPNTLNMGSLLSGSVVTSSTLSMTYSTNAVNGGSIYMAGQFLGLRSASSSGYVLKVNAPGGDLSSLSEGFGLKGLTASAPLSIQSPFNGTGNNVGAVTTTFQPVYAAASAVASGSATATLIAKSSVATPSATDYQDVLTFIAAATF